MNEIQFLKTGSRKITARPLVMDSQSDKVALNLALMNMCETEPLIALIMPEDNHLLFPAWTCIYFSVLYFVFIDEVVLHTSCISGATKY